MHKVIWLVIAIYGCFAVFAWLLAMVNKPATHKSRPSLIQGLRKVVMTVLLFVAFIGALQGFQLVIYIVVSLLLGKSLDEIAQRIWH